MACSTRYVIRFHVSSWPSSCEKHTAIRRSLSACVTAAPVPAPAPAGPPLTATITITPKGMDPVDVTIAAGGRVTFTNTDNEPHDVQGGVDVDHPDCHEIDAVGFLTP